MKKQFKNSFAITGPRNLLEAFRKDCEAMGWKFRDRGIISDSLFFRADDTGGDLKPGYYHYSDGFWSKGYRLPIQYLEALEAAKETIEEELKPGDWVRVLDTPNVRKYDSNGLGIGYIFQVVEEPLRDWLKGKSYSNCNGNKFHTNYKLTDLQKISKEEAEEHILKQAIEESGLKVGYQFIGSSNMQTYKKEDNKWISGAFTKGYEVIGHIMFEDRPCCIFKSYGNSYYLPIKTIVDFNENNIKIDKYTAEKAGDSIAFGCQRLTKSDLETVKKLLNKEINASITIKGVKIDLSLISKLEKLLQNG